MTGGPAVMGPRREMARGEGRGRAQDDSRLPFTGEFQAETGTLRRRPGVGGKIMSWSQDMLSLRNP